MLCLIFWTIRQTIDSIDDFWNQLQKSGKALLKVSDNLFAALSGVLQCCLGLLRVVCGLIALGSMIKGFRWCSEVVLGVYLSRLGFVRHQPQSESFHSVKSSMMFNKVPLDLLQHTSDITCGPNPLWSKLSYIETESANHNEMVEANPAQVSCFPFMFLRLLLKFKSTSDALQKPVNELI